MSKRTASILRLHDQGKTPVEIACELLCDVTMVHRTITEHDQTATASSSMAPAFQGETRGIPSTPSSPASAPGPSAAPSGSGGGISKPKGGEPRTVNSPAPTSTGVETDAAAVAVVTEHGVSIAMPEAEASAFLDVSSLQTPAGVADASDAPAVFSGEDNSRHPHAAYIRKAWTGGIPTAEIAEATGVKAPEVRKHAARLGLPPRTRTKAVAEDASRSVVRGGRRPNPQGGSNAPSPAIGRAAAPAVAAPVVPTAVPAVAARRAATTQSRPGTAPPSKGLGPGADDGLSISPAGAAPMAQAPADLSSSLHRPVYRTGVPLSEVEPCGCRWPVSKDRPHRFCNAPAEPGKPYCAAHAVKSSIKIAGAKP